MKKLLLLAGVALGALSAGLPAQAAELGQVSGPGATFNWGGFYVGANAGYMWGRQHWTYVPSPGVGPFDSDGAVGGGTAGFNIDSGDWIFGVEGDYDWSGADGSDPCPNPTYSCESELSSFGTLRARAGYDVGPALGSAATLLYVTGGMAFGQLEIRTVGPSGAGEKKTPFGWTVGAGSELAFGENWSAKIEYLYYDLGEDTYTVDFGDQVNAELKGSVVRIGVNYLF